MCHCSLCNQSSFFAVDLGKYHPNVPDYHLCMNCGLIQHCHIMSSSELASFYETDYSDNYIETTYTQNKTYTPYLESIEKQGWLLAGDNVLDIGCANGGFLRLLKDRGYFCLGVEPSPKMTEQARENGLDVVCTTLENFSFHLKFDRVFLNHALEHFSAPLLALIKIKTLLADEGTVIIVVPTLSSQQPSSPFKLIHPFVFTETTMKNLAVQAGYAIESLRVVGANIRAVLKPLTTPSLKKIACNPDAEIKKVTSFIKDREKIIEDMQVKIANLKKDTKIVVYGAGGIAQFLLSDTQLSTYNIIAFIDSDKEKQGKLFWEKVYVMPVEAIASLNYDVVVIASHLFAEEMAATLMQHGVKPNQILKLAASA